MDATCTAPKTCSVCKATEGEALGHTWVNATCTTPKTCSVCGATEGAALGHIEVIDAAKTPTCTETGLTEGKHCSVCGEVLVAQTVVDALGHNYDKTKSEDNLTRPFKNSDGSWIDGYYTFTCRNDNAHTTTEAVQRRVNLQRC